jgi:hypothetical protein
MNGPSALLLTALLALAGCGQPARDNPYDPQVSRYVDLQAAIVGSWGREDVEANQVYTFRTDGRVELRDYAAPGGGAVDRNAAYPQTLVLTYSGTYELAGSVLRISYSEVSTNDPAGTVPSLPAIDSRFVVRVAGAQLSLEGSDGLRFFQRL